MKNPNQGKNLGKAMLVGTALVSLSSPQQAHAVLDDGAMSALVLAPISVTTDQILSFGSMSVGATGDTVLINADTGARTQGGGGAVSLLTGGALAPQRGQVVVGAATGLQINISMDATSYPMGIGGAAGASPMNVDNFNLLTAAGGTTGNFTITATTAPSVGVFTVGVGATLNVLASQPAGLYQGIYTVDVNYN